MQSGQKRARTDQPRDESVAAQIERARFYAIIETWDSCSYWGEMKDRNISALAHVLDMDEEVFKFRQYLVEYRVEMEIGTVQQAMADAEYVQRKIFALWTGCAQFGHDIEMVE